MKGDAKVIEMLNAENKAVKRFGINQLIARGIRVRKYAHDCSCQFKHEWEMLGLCAECLLDGFHWKTHKCNVPKVTDQCLNSQAAEQLWSRLDGLHFSTEYTRAHYRYFLREYFIWRNSFLRSKHSVDVNPCVSGRQAHRHR